MKIMLWQYLIVNQCAVSHVSILYGLNKVKKTNIVLRH